MMSVLDLQSLGKTEYALGFCGAILTLYLLSKKLRGKQLLLPPGPKPLPIVGNLLDLPKGGEIEGQFWAKHKALYGPISSVSVFGQTIIVLNDYKAALELLDRRSSMYSDRPVFTFAGEMAGLGVLTTLLRYDDTLKLHRKSFHNYIGTRAAMAQHESLEEVEARRFLLRIIDDPENLMDHIRSLPGAVILKMSHGYSINHDGPDPLVELADYVMCTLFSEAVQAGIWLVDTLPFLKHVPAWMPGAGFKRKARNWYKTTNEFYRKPHAFVKHEIASGRAAPSLTSKLLEEGIAEKYGDDVVKYITASFYGGGADTTVIALKTFFLAMILYPNVFKRAQEEIDRVVGHDRLPSFSDRANLPYIGAVLKETLRWENVVPAGAPHVTTEDDVYMGYHIPKGALVLPIIWQMAHDPEAYSDPFSFKPERFLGGDGRKPEMDSRNIAFGFGRRICPGKELAESTLFIAIAMTAASFDISKAKDESGQEIEPVHEYSPGLLSNPKPFKFAMQPRSERAIALIRSVVEEHPFQTGDSDVLKSI